MNNIRKSNTSESQEKAVLIKKLIVKNTNVDLVFRDSKRPLRHLKPIEYMEFNNISSEGGLPSSQITNLVMSEVLKEVFNQEKLMNMLKDVLQQPKGNLNPLKSFFSQVDKETETE